ncbi:hypothetical protein GF318_05410 [Candidatus Micrarchaeota archaeon]|nr:hypothetical protein [Candidatus Micrarchaeota archaeon]
MRLAFRRHAERKNLLRGIRAPVAAAAFAATLLFSGISGAQETCTLKKVAGPAETLSRVYHTGKRVDSLTVRVPAMEKGHHLELSMPGSYSRKLAEKAAKGDAREKVRDAVLANLDAGLKRLKSSSISFKCAPIAEPPSSEVKTVPVPEKQPEKKGEKLIIRRRRTIGSAGKAAPLAVRDAGGKGTREDPFAITISVPAKGEAGKVIYHRDDSPYFISLGESSVHFTFRFVGVKSEAAVTSRRRLSRRIAGEMADRLNREARKKGSGVAFTASDLSTPANKIVDEAAGERAAIRAYAPE